MESTKEHKALIPIGESIADITMKLMNEWNAHGYVVEMVFDTVVNTGHKIISCISLYSSLNRNYFG